MTMSLLKIIYKNKQHVFSNRMRRLCHSDCFDRLRETLNACVFLFYCVFINFLSQIYTSQLPELVKWGRIVLLLQTKQLE